MNKFLFIVSCLLMFVACESSNDKSDKNIESETVKNEYMPVVIEFSATWCGPCQQLKPVFEALTDEYKGKVEMESVDVDENPSLARKYSIQNIPTTIFFDKQGNEVERIVGYVPKSKLEQSIKSLLK
jgi:thioredoxin 1